MCSCFSACSFRLSLKVLGRNIVSTGVALLNVIFDFLSRKIREGHV